MNERVGLKEEAIDCERRPGRESGKAMRLLVITHTFPPSGHSNAKRPYYLVKGFLKAGWEVDVYTSPLAMEKGAEELLKHPALRIFRVLEPIDAIKQRFAGYGRLFKWVSLGIAGLLWPDTFPFWARRVFRKIRRGGASYDRVLAFVFPPSVLLSGNYRGFVDRSWTFDMQESVTPQFRDLPRRSPLNKLLTPRLGRIERSTLSQAGRVVFTAETNRKRYIADGLVAEEITAHVPYFFDAEAFAETAQPERGRFAIYYFGMFDWQGSRSPETFLRSLARFLEARPEARATTQFVFHGRWLSEHDRFIHELRLEDVISIRAVVGPEAYLEQLKVSPILLLVVASAHKLFMPSKIVDYFGARRPILAFVPDDSEMRQVLAHAGMNEFVCGEYDVEAGTEAIERLWERHRTSGLAVDSQHVERWSSEALIPRYIELVRSLPVAEGGSSATAPAEAAKKTSASGLQAQP